ncbi:hypothetical protein C1I99_31525 [Micromonospora deserti]|uniref:Uncharacterized protein n=1 Tax=Micromonospora deserti TaxID=2070366 RepID=A0A2W2BB48_9ACTN|nr:hypothetical protein C1I99_31525 [Micromonospora deserti]
MAETREALRHRTRGALHKFRGGWLVHLAISAFVGATCLVGHLMYGLVLGLGYALLRPRLTGNR